MLFCFHQTDAISLPRLLIKIPTRSRPERFFKMLDLYYAKLSKKIPYTFVISCDADDATMNNETVLRKLHRYPHLSYHFGNSKTKVEAYNADMDKHNDWDILLVTSDDMEPIVQDYDIIIVQNMLGNFPDYDGVLNFHDGHIGSELNTYPIIGKRYYDRFGYIYAPCYQALWCDNELTNVSKILRKEKTFKNGIIRHNNPVWGLNPADELFQKNEKLGRVSDPTTYIKRRESNFYIDQKDIDNATPKMWSILICTLENRAESFNHIYTKLQKQIAELGLQNQIEILYFKDNRENSVGFKRNWLLEQSCGKYVCYVDDDDDVSDDYIKTIYEKLLKNPDCVNLQGIITFGGRDPRLFIHSIRYNTYFEKDNIYYRPPNHLNPIKRMYGCLFLFPEINRGEDTNWAMQIVQAELLKYEEEVDNPYYFYLYDPVKTIDKQGNS
jgi:hypothetical protein